MRALTVFERGALCLIVNLMPNKATLQGLIRLNLCWNWINEYITAHGCVASFCCGFVVLFRAMAKEFLFMKESIEKKWTRIWKNTLTYIRSAVPSPPFTRAKLFLTRLMA